MLTDEIKARSFVTRLGAAILVAAVFVIISSVELGGQGLPFDEIPLAPASFLYLDKAPYPPHTFLAWHNIPLLAVTYIGAAKSNCFGAAMKYLHVQFSVVSWRFVGIVFVAVGLLFFITETLKYFPLLSVLVFSILFLTDITVLIYTRVDFGPMALSLMCRLIWIAVWLREEFNEKRSFVTTFVLGFIPSFMVYEKLNNVVFFLPLVAIILSSKERRTFRYLRMLFAGSLVGAFPFVFVNVVTNGVSFRQLGSESSVALVGRPPFGTFAKIFLGLGAGQEVKSFVLGDPPTRWIKYTEVVLVSALLAVAAKASLFRLRLSPVARIAVIVVLAYYGLGLATWLLPRGTGIHHWIVSTPFQYCAIALLIPLTKGAKETPLGRFSIVIPAMIAVLVVLRIVNLVDVEASLRARHYSKSWNIALTTATMYFAEHHGEGNFIAADYGFGAQTYCFSNGDFILPEPFWKYEGPQQLRPMISQKKNAPVYVIYNAEPSVIGIDRRNHVLGDLREMLGPNQLPLDRELKNLDGIVVEKYPYPPDE